MTITRRFFLLGSAGLALSACAEDRTEGIVAEPVDSPFSSVSTASYGALADEPYPIPAVDLKKWCPQDPL